MHCAKLQFAETKYRKDELHIAELHFAYDVSDPTAVTRGCLPQVLIKGDLSTATSTPWMQAHLTPEPLP